MWKSRPTTVVRATVACAVLFDAVTVVAAETGAAAAVAPAATAVHRGRPSGMRA